MTQSNADWLDETIGAAEASARRAKEREELLHAMAAELKALEWQGCDACAMPTCPSCGEDRPDPDYDDGSEHHARDCALAALLARYESLYPKEGR